MGQRPPLPHQPQMEPRPHAGGAHGQEGGSGTDTARGSDHRGVASEASGPTPSQTPVRPPGQRLPGPPTPPVQRGPNRRRLGGRLRLPLQGRTGARRPWGGRAEQSLPSGLQTFSAEPLLRGPLLCWPLCSVIRGSLPELPTQGGSGPGWPGARHLQPEEPWEGLNMDPAGWASGGGLGRRQRKQQGPPRPLRSGSCAPGLAPTSPRKDPPGPGSGGTVIAPQCPSLTADGAGGACPGKAGFLPHLPEAIAGPRNRGPTPLPEPRALPTPRWKQGQALRLGAADSLKGLLDSNTQRNKQTTKAHFEPTSKLRVASLLSGPRRQLPRHLPCRNSPRPIY